LSREAREVLADWLILFGAIGLLVALFLPWSHQFTHGLPGVPRSPTAWQVYSVVDVLLALLAGGLLAVALLGGRIPRLVVLLGAAVAAGFAVHALSVPPTNGANIVAPIVAPASGAGEVVAIAALGVAIAGVGLSFTAA
jgi:hypothetical protein